MTYKEKFSRLKESGVPVIGTGSDSLGNYLRFENDKLIFYETGWEHPHDGDYIEGSHREDCERDYSYLVKKMEDYYFDKNRVDIMNKLLYKQTWTSPKN